MRRRLRLACSAMIRWIHRWTSPIATIVIAVTTVVYTCTSLRQWQAMLESNGISQNAFASSQRAFVYFLPPSLSGKPPTRQFDVVLGIGNSGNTPTVELSYRLECLWPNSGTITLNDPEQPLKLPDRAILGPKVVISPISCSAEVSTDGAIKDSLGHSANSVAVVGKATYKDSIRSEKHETRFCYTLGGFRIGADLQILGAVSGPCNDPRYNCADDECKEQDRMASQNPHGTSPSP
jgi:hypothetical protein